MDADQKNICNHCENPVQQDEKIYPGCSKSTGWSRSRYAKLLSIGIVAWFIVLLFILAENVPKMIRFRSMGYYTACQSNMKNIGACLDLYYKDHNGHYPAKLSEISPDYVRSMPTCQAAGEDSYSESYRSTESRDAYTFCCEGEHHTTLTGINTLIYTSGKGLVPGKKSRWWKTTK